VTLALALVASIVGLFFSGINTQNNKPRLPRSLETGFDQRSRQVVWTATASVVSGVIFIIQAFGKTDFSESYALLGIVCCLGAMVIRTWDTTSTQKRSAKLTAFTTAPMVYRVTLPRDQSWQPQVSQRFIEHLIRTIPHIALRIVAEQNSIHWEVLDWRTGTSPRTIIQTIHTYYPDAEVAAEPFRFRPGPYPFYRHTLFFCQASDFVWPIKSVEASRNSTHWLFCPSHVGAWTRRAHHLYPGIVCACTYAAREGAKMITVSTVQPRQFLSILGAPLALVDMVSGPTREEKYRESDQKIARGKSTIRSISAFWQLILTAQHVDASGKLPT
jgi:hypothetical protein